MRNKFLIAAMASMILAGCTNDQQMLDEAMSAKEIRFAVASGTEQTRAEHDIDGSYSGDLKIWAWVKGTNSAIIDGDVYNAASNTFAENKIYYYPIDGKQLDFLAVPNELITKGYFVDPVRGNTGETDYRFTVGHDSHASEHHNTDLMTSEVITQSTGVVGIVLRHLSAKLNVRIQQVQKQNEVTTCVVTLNKVELQDLKNTGYVDLDENWTAVNNGDDCFWTNIEAAKVCDWTILDGANFALATHIPTEPNTPYTTGNPHYVVPQQLDPAGQKLYMEYTIETKYISGNQPDVVEKFKKELDLSSITAVPAWAMNKNITYIISINPMEESHKITFDVEVEAWGNQTGETTVTPGDSENI